jgi:hypothetical protein
MGTRKQRSMGKYIRTKKPNVPACSPFAKKHQVASDTCFTKDTLFELKRIYNEHNSGKQIVSTVPKDIWREIKRDRIKQCEKDSCWISHIVKDEQTKKKLHSLLFPPVPPSEWKKDPTTWLTNYDILHVLRQYHDTYPEFHFMGPCPIDFATILDDGKCVNPEICKFSLSNKNKKHTKIGVVFNLDRHDQSGSHWVSLFMDFVDNFIFYFDSTGEKIPREIEIFVKKVISQKKMDVYTSTTMEHQMKDTECGMYSLYFIITMLLREREDGTIMSKEEVIALFKGKFGRIKDDDVQELRGSYFSDGGKKKRKHHKTVRFRLNNG